MALVKAFLYKIYKLLKTVPFWRKNGRSLNHGTTQRHAQYFVQHKGIFERIINDHDFYYINTLSNCQSFLLCSTEVIKTRRKPTKKRLTNRNNIILSDIDILVLINRRTKSYSKNKEDIQLTFWPLSKNTFFQCCNTSGSSITFGANICTITQQKLDL